MTTDKQVALMAAISRYHTVKLLDEEGDKKLNSSEQNITILETAEAYYQWLKDKKGFPLQEQVLKGKTRTEMVLSAIIGSKNPEGIMIPEMQEVMFQEYGFRMSPTTINAKIKSLISEGFIYQLNEGSLRGKRYLPKGKEE